MRKLLVILFLISFQSKAQELYVNTEPASNMAAKSIGIRLADKIWFHSNHNPNRIVPEIMLGINKDWMIHVEGSIADYYTASLKPESINLYAKYRFYTIDGIQTHFRIAAYGRISYSENKGFIDDLNIEGDISGYSAGIVATQLLHKLALSITLGQAKALNTNKSLKVLNGNAYNYSLSAGYLLFPRKYVSYDQLNVNLYLELLGKTNPTIYDKEFLKLVGGNSLALAPAIQFIISSQTRIDIGYKTDLYNTGIEMGDMLLFRLEYNLFNVWKSKPLE